jgi:hypothetical protein
MAMENLVQQLSRISDVEDALPALEPVLGHPLLLPFALLAVAVVTPIVEELTKSIAPWMLGGRLRGGAQGFWAGAISGAGFGLFEGLMASAGSAEAPALVLFIRGWSSLMHILASGLAGWGIGSFLNGGKITRLFAGYTLAILVHALWNASVVSIGYGGLRAALHPAGPDLVSTLLLGAGAMVLIGLMAGLPVALTVLNQRLRSNLTRPLPAGEPSGQPTDLAAGPEA